MYGESHFTSISVMRLAALIGIRGCYTNDLDFCLIARAVSQFRTFSSD